jgi:hypothetical protein
MLGKGPSFSRISEFPTDRFETISLNHVVRERPVTAAHVIDIDVVHDCGDILLKNAQVVVMPWQPHRNNWVAKPTLDEWADKVPVLGQLRSEGRLLWYNLGTGKSPRPDSPIVPVRFFSAVAVLGLLGQAGIRNVRSLGIDGGAAYSATFQDLEEKTRLSNGWSNFDVQFEEFPKIMLRTGVEYAPLDAETPVRVYVAQSPSEMLPTRILEYSIRKYSSVSVKVLPLDQAGIEIPRPAAAANQARTPFSFQRFIIPEAAGRQGKAIYLDADMQLFADIRALWQTPMGDADILTVMEPPGTGRQPQYSVMLLDCAKLSWDIREIVRRLDAGEMTYEQLMYDMAAGGTVARTLDPAWNSLERYAEGRTALLHYTDMSTQPWVYRGNPLGYLWTRDLLAAVRTGFISRDLVADHVSRGWVRPSLLVQIDEDINDPLLLGRGARRLDRDFVPPYRALGSGRAISLGARANAAARDAYFRSPLPFVMSVLKARFARK